MEIGNWKYCSMETDGTYGIAVLETVTVYRLETGIVESLQSCCIHTQFHWSSGPPVSFLSWENRVQSPGGYLCEIVRLLLVLSRYRILFSWIYCKEDPLKAEDVCVRRKESSLFYVNFHYRHRHCHRGIFETDCRPVLETEKRSMSLL
jgi:hypothetical protein